MPYHDRPLINAADLAVTRREIGPAFARILGYYRQDGVVSITTIEDAMAERNAAAIILPAHSLKGESLQFAAMRMAELAQHIEMTARQCVEERIALPDTLDHDVGQMRLCFHETVKLLEAAIAASPPIARTAATRPVFGRRAAT
jgi:HPt (histidine-containing phosphotransfer) domain-containing protein